MKPARLNAVKIEVAVGAVVVVAVVIEIEIEIEEGEEVPGVIVAVETEADAVPSSLTRLTD